ncbi:hypothetical protein BGZ88_005639, partial [Linnemannia elongata]
MSNELHPTLHHDNVRKRDRIFNFFKSSSSESKARQSQSTKGTLLNLSTDTAQYNDDIEHEFSGVANPEHAVSTTEVKSPISNVQSSALPTKPCMTVFSQNVNPPVVLINLPEFGSRVDATPQLALCIGLLLKGCDLINQEEHPSQLLSSGNAAKLAWIKSMKQDLVEQERLRWVGARMVDEFAKDASKDSIEIAEM